MFDLAMYLLVGLAFVALAIIGAGALALPAYLLVRWRDSARAPSAAELAEIDRVLAQA